MYKELLLSVCAATSLLALPCQTLYASDTASNVSNTTMGTLDDGHTFHSDSSFERSKNHVLQDHLKAGIDNYPDYPSRLDGVLGVPTLWFQGGNYQQRFTVGQLSIFRTIEQLFITDQCMDGFDPGSFPNLRILHLENFSDPQKLEACLKNIEPLIPRITVLDMSGSTLNRDSLGELARFTQATSQHLETLSLRLNRQGHEFIQDVMGRAPYPKLRTLVLTDLGIPNPAFESGGMIYKMIENIGQFPKLLHLDLRGNKLSNPTIWDQRALEVRGDYLADQAGEETPVPIILVNQNESDLNYEDFRRCMEAYRSYFIYRIQTPGVFRECNTFDQLLDARRGLLTADDILRGVTFRNNRPNYNLFWFLGNHATVLSHSIPNITNLDFSGNTYDPAVVAFFLNHFRNTNNLNTLKLQLDTTEVAPQNHDNLVEALARFGKLSTIDFSNTDFADPAIFKQYINFLGEQNSPFPHLEELKFHNCNLSGMPDEEGVDAPIVKIFQKFRKAALRPNQPLMLKLLDLSNNLFSMSDITSFFKSNDPRAFDIYEHQLAHVIKFEDNSFVENVVEDDLIHLHKYVGQFLAKDPNRRTPRSVIEGLLRAYQIKWNWEIAHPICVKHFDVNNRGDLDEVMPLASFMARLRYQPVLQMPEVCEDGRQRLPLPNPTEIGQLDLMTVLPLARQYDQFDQDTQTTLARLFTQRNMKKTEGSWNQQEAMKMFRTMPTEAQHALLFNAAFCQTGLSFGRDTKNELLTQVLSHLI